MKNSLTSFNHWPLVILLAIFIVVTAIFSLTIPLDAAPDEKEHFDLVRFVAQHNLPPLTPKEREIVGYKGDASPIYHTIVAYLSQYVDVSVLPRRHALGVPELFIPFDTILDNRTFHTENELFPFRGIVLAWHLARLATILLAATTLIAVYLTVLTICPTRRYFALAGAGFAAFVPRFVINSAVINDDNLVIPLTTFAIYYLVRVIHGNTTRQTLIILGLFMGLAAITKYHALVLLPETTLAFGLLAWHQGQRWRLWLRRWGWAMAGFLLSSAAWFIFLFVQFNRVAELGWLGGLIAPMGDPVITDSSGFSFLTQPLAWDWVIPLFRSFWMALEGTRIFGPPLIDLFLAGLTLLALLGLLKWSYSQITTRQLTATQLSVGLLALHFFIYLAIVFVRYQTRAATGLGYAAAPHNIQGRHLYPALIAIAFLFTLGLSQIAGSLPGLKRVSQPTRDKGLALALSGSLIAAGAIAFFFYIRPTYLPYLPLLTLEPDQLPITHRANEDFVKGVRFVGYDIGPTQPAGDTLPITLYWQARANLERDYLTQLCLQDSSGQTITCYRGHPANGLFPHRFWAAGHIIKDKINLPLPHCLQPGSYGLALAIFPLRLDRAGTQIDPAAEQPPPLALGSLNLSPPAANPAVNLSLCTAAGCQPPGEINLPQLRESLLVLQYGPNRAVPKMQPAAAGQPAWLPLDHQTSYQCPSGQQVTTHAFIVDRSIPPGAYRLQPGAQTEAGWQVNVKTRQRNFAVPQNLQQPLNISFAGIMEILGYEIDLSPRRPDEPVTATLYWRAQKTTDRNYVATLHLLDHKFKMWRQSDHEVGGLYPNILWAPGEVVADVHTLHAPGQPLPPGLYTIELGLYDPLQGFDFLPMLAGDTDQPLSQPPILGQIRIFDPARTTPPQQPVQVTLNNELQLLGYDLPATRLSAGQPLSLALHWQALAPLSTDYTVFTQLIGPDGLVYAQQDNPPQQGRYPTTAWPVEERVVDRYELTLKEGAPAGQYQLLVGMYNWMTGERLPAIDANGNRLPNDAITLAPVTVEQPADTLP